jgi:hypothetical protein
MPIKRQLTSHASVAQACNPSYSEGRDQEDHGSKLAWANFSLQDSILKKPFTKMSWWVAHGVYPEFNPQYQKKKKKKKVTDCKQNSMKREKDLLKFFTGEMFFL